METPVSEFWTNSRLRGLDALRGLAALCVVAYHVVGAHPKPGTGGIFSWIVMPVLHAITFGYCSVFLFFVISGFCIHLQWARTKASGQEPNLDFGSFWRRRLRRLYPPYLIALALYLVIAALTSDVKVSAFYVWDVVSHALMLHNLDTHTVYSINGVFWTLAIEEQLYLAYFLLLFLRKKWGWGVTLSVCLATRVAWLFLVNILKSTYGIDTPLSEAAFTHWFTWALGAVSVEAACGLIRLPRFLSKLRFGVLALALALGIAFFLDNYSTAALHDPVWMFMHPAWGIGFFIIVNYMVALELRWRTRQTLPAWIGSFAKIGTFSYSLYLIHELVLMETWRFYFLGMSDTMTGLLITTPLSVACAWVFFMVCERPFMAKSWQLRVNDNKLVQPSSVANLG
jgi:peptidoglycan/LPS O-acetylase OafA/YrhL